MNLLALLLSLLMAILAPFSALAATVNYVPGTGGAGGTISTQVPLTKVGKLNIPDGVATLHDHTIDVVGTLAGTKQNVLSGVVLKADVSVSGSHGKLTGLAYFRQGPGLTAIDDPNAEETIDVKGGRVISGHIVSINRDQVEIVDRSNTNQQVATVDVSTIHSPRAFAFTMGLLAAAGTAISLTSAFTATSAKLSLSPTFVAAKVAAVTAPKTVAPGAGPRGTVSPGTTGPGTTSPGTTGPAPTPATGSAGMSLTTKLILATVGVLGVATAIAVPVAVGCATHRAHMRHRHAVEQQQNITAMLLYLQTHQQPAPSMASQTSTRLR